MSLTAKKKLLEDWEKFDAEQSESSLFHYFKSAWRTLEPATDLKHNWHHGLICEYLTACHLRQIKRLIINIPPRNAKSTLVSVCFPTWTWIRTPQERFLATSYSQSLSTKHSVDRRRLIQSNWYQENWGKRFNLMGDQNVKTEFENSRRGHMIATSMTGTATGKGGNFILVDDPGDPTSANSEVERQNTIDAFDQKFRTRLDDKANGVIIIIMQRLHMNDLTGHLLEGTEKWEHLKIPAIEEDQRKVYSFPISKKEKIRLEGDVMHPARESLVVLQGMKDGLGSFAYSGQYQQDPVPREGGMLKRGNWNFYDVLPLKFDEIIGTFDCSFKEKESSDYVVGGVMGRMGVKKYMLPWFFRERAGFNKTKDQILRCKLAHRQMRRVLIEDTANGPAIIESMKVHVSGLTAITASKSKTERVSTVEPDHEAKNYYLPNPKFHPWVIPFIEECANFPKAKNDDQVDMFTQAANWYLDHEAKSFDKLIQW